MAKHYRDDDDFGRPVGPEPQRLHNLDLDADVDRIRIGHPLTKTIIALLIVAGIAIAALILAGKAQATPQQDAQFIHLIDEFGAPIGMHIDDYDVAVRQGRAVCDLFDEGYDTATIIRGVDMALPLYESGAQVLVAAAVVTYCPEHRIDTPTFIA